MFCENCGKQIASNISFCTRCGKKLGSAAGGGQDQIENTTAQINQNRPVPPVMRPNPRPTENPAENFTSQPRQPLHPSQAYGDSGVHPAQAHVHPGQARPTSPRIPGQRGTVGSPTVGMTYGEYLISFIITAIPLVGFIFLIKWGFIDKDNPNKSNLAKALLTMYLVGFVFAMIWFAILGSMMRSGFYY